MHYTILKITSKPQSTVSEHVSCVINLSYEEWFNYFHLYHSDVYKRFTNCYIWITLPHLMLSTIDTAML